MTPVEEKELTSVEIVHCENDGTFEIDIGSIICGCTPFFK